MFRRKKKKGPELRVEWEQIKSDLGSLWRTKVPGGWLVAVPQAATLHGRFQSVQEGLMVVDSDDPPYHSDCACCRHPSIAPHVYRIYS